MCAFGGKSKQGNSSSGAGTGRSLMSTLSMNSGARTALSYCGNGAIAAAVVAATLALRQNVITPSRQGFFCSDPSIRYPVREESVSTKMILAVGTLFVLGLAVVTEFFEAKASEMRSRWHWMVKAAKGFAIYLLGFVITTMLFEMGKAATGVLRPNFMAICGPDVDCRTADPHEYHTDFGTDEECTSSPFRSATR